MKLHKRLTVTKAATYHFVLIVFQKYKLHAKLVKATFRITIFTTTTNNCFACTHSFPGKTITRNLIDIKPHAGH